MLVTCLMSIYWPNLFWPQITPKSFANWKLFVLSMFLWNKRQKQVGMKYYEPGPSPPPITTKNQLLIIAILAKMANKPLFFANIESPAGYLWQFTSVAIYVVSVITFWRQGRYICFRPELSLIIIIIIIIVIMMMIWWWWWCYYFLAARRAVHLFSGRTLSHHCQRFCRVINLSKAHKNRWVVLLGFFSKNLLYPLFMAEADTN